MGSREMHGIEDDAVAPVTQQHAEETFAAYQTVMADVFAELAVATAKFPPMRSGHEGWAILLEEVDELNEAMDIMWDQIKADDLDAAMAEARQVAAMALRFVHDMQALRASEAGRV